MFLLATIFIKLNYKKKQKYEPIAQWLTANNIPTVFIHVNVQTGNANLLVEIEKIKKYQTQEFDSLVFFRATSIIDDKKKLGSQLY